MNFVGELEYISTRSVFGYPVRVYQTIGRDLAEPFCVAPCARGGWLNGCLVQGRTVDEAVDRLREFMPGVIRFLRRECGMSPRPAPRPNISIEGCSLRVWP